MTASGFVLGKNIDLSAWQRNNIVIDELNHVYCFVGYRMQNQPDHIQYYSPCVALKDSDGRSSYRFIKLSHGTLNRSGFLNDNQYYQVLMDRWVVYPSGANSYFGVITKNNRNEDSELSRAIFGGTYEEIEQVATALAKITGRNHHEMSRLPRLTFSKSRNNRCDVTGCLIPQEFPYIAFEDAQYDWSHVSIYGLYRLLSFLCHSLERSPAWQALIDKDIPEDVLKRFISNGDGNANPILAQEYL